jgi:hypothetical protein
VSCHSVTTNGVPAAGFSGKPPANPGSVYPPNITPDATGIQGWAATDVVNLLKTSLPKGSTAPVCNMPSYSGLTDIDALAIGLYITTIPSVSNPDASLTDEPACP